MTTQNPFPLCPKNTSQHDARRGQWWQNLQWAKGDCIAAMEGNEKGDKFILWQLWENTSKLAADVKSSGKK